ncbi:hypothetical protein AX16_007322 [Volvariella volvacea WC 439]|nr:hypothetical protein AX16_007322 [Volvariella volvacea WC 439]
MNQCSQTRPMRAISFTQPSAPTSRPSSHVGQVPEFLADVSQNVQNDGTFINNVGNGNYVYNYHWQGVCANVGDRAKKRLLKEIVHDAMHTGNVRADPLECHPNTRQAIVDDIVSWMEDSRRSKNVLWLRGPAGIGKSAIAKTTADRLESGESKAKVAGSFFFFRNDPRRDNIDGLIPTLVYRLTITIQGFKEGIDRVFKENPEILYSSLEEQWKKLIVEPVMAIGNIPPSAIVIDGLDECGGPNDQRKVMDLIASCGPLFPIAFLVASRPEPHLVNCFNAEPLSSLCRSSIDLTACKDHGERIVFIKARFSRTYTLHRDILQFYSVNGAWPAQEVVHLLAQRADGQFVYPVTLFKYIEDDSGNPHERLQACIAQSPEALSPLDALYMQIMESSHEPDNDQVQMILFLLFIRHLPVIPRPSLPEDKSGYLAYLQPSIENVACVVAQWQFHLRKLHSVLKIPDKDTDEIKKSSQILPRLPD